MFDLGNLELSALQWMLLGLCAFMVGISKTGVPGFGILVVLLSALVMPAKASVGFVLPLLIFADIFAAAYYHRKAKWEHVFRLLPWTFLGIIAATFSLEKINDQQLKPIIGIIVLQQVSVYLLGHLRSHLYRTAFRYYHFASKVGLICNARSFR